MTDDQIIKKLCPDLYIHLKSFKDSEVNTASRSVMKLELEGFKKCILDLWREKESKINMDSVSIRLALESAYKKGRKDACDEVIKMMKGGE